MRIGVKIDNFGPEAGRILDAARVADAAGFASGWISDRLINPAVQGSPYPFTPDKSVPWPADVTFVEAIVSMTAIAAVTERIEVAAGVLVLPQRNPVVVAKQIASLDALSGGRVTLGVGTGWMAEEFEALGADFKTRGARTDEAIAVMRSLWQGVSAGYEGRFYRVAEGTHCHPTPAHEIPIIVGGMTPAALRRASRHGDGWLGLVRLERLDVDEVRGLVETIRQQAADAGRDPAAQRCVLRVSGEPTAVAEVAPALRKAGIDELVIDARLHDVDEARAAFEAVADQVAA
jgi:probable F420-dependent oxidoreductase